MSDVKEIEVLVASRVDAAPGVAIFELKAVAGALPAYDAGAHVEVTIAEGIVRPYSLCTPPERAGLYRIGVLRDANSRGGSAAIHEQFAPGRKVTIGAPRNLFPLHDGEEKSLLLGGGIGVTPILAMAYALQARGRDFELHYCVRSRTQAAFLDEISTRFGARAAVHADDETEAQTLDLDAVLAAQPPGTHIYVCGPTGFMDWIIAAARKAGFNDPRIHFEYFAAEVSTEGAAFEVVAKRSGVTVEVGPKDTILNALARAGVRIKKSCEQGVCGTCICDVLEGEPDHRDTFLNDEEHAAGDQIAACCSRARGARLVLDI